MAKKTKVHYVCSECGQEHPKYQGRCDNCGAWNTLKEFHEAKSQPKQARWVPQNEKLPNRPRPLQAVETQRQQRFPLPGRELNRVLDGGLVPGSLTLLGGEPGIGKSTLLLQVGLRIAPEKVLYVSGEESAEQIKLRAERMRGENPELLVYPETQLETILRQAEEIKPRLLILDSIQTLYSGQVDAAPGSLSQVRDCTARLMQFAKKTGTATWLVGHINKEGAIAGPKVLEHMVDTVLEFEGDRHYNFRIIRSIKNRFGATPEIGIYEMVARGLREVENPSEVFLSPGATDYPGVAVGSTLQGMRPLLVEVQALVSKAAYGTPQRSATGLDTRRISMLLAVLEKKAGFRFFDQDVFVNLAGGIRLEDPALDLAIVSALVSSLEEVPLNNRYVLAGEVGLTGEVRSIQRVEPRLAEAEKLGFEKIFLPAGNQKGLSGKNYQIEIGFVNNLTDIFRELFG